MITTVHVNSTVQFTFDPSNKIFVRILVVFNSCYLIRYIFFLINALKLLR